MINKNLLIDRKVENRLIAVFFLFKKKKIIANYFMLLNNINQKALIDFKRIKIMHQKKS